MFDEGNSFELKQQAACDFRVSYNSSQDPFISTVTALLLHLFKPAWKLWFKFKTCGLHSGAIVIATEALMEWTKKEGKKGKEIFLLWVVKRRKKDIYSAFYFGNKKKKLSVSHAVIKNVYVFVFSFILTATCYQYVKYFREKNFISTQFVTQLPIGENKVIDKESTYIRRGNLLLFYVYVLLINISFRFSGEIHFCHKLSRNIRTGSSLKIYFLFRDEANFFFGFHILPRGKREKTEKRNKRNFHRNTRTTVTKYWVEEKAKKENFKQSSNKCTKQSWNQLGFVRLSSGKRKGGAMKSVNILRRRRKIHHLQHSSFLGIFLEINFILTLLLFILRRHCHKHDTTIHNQSTWCSRKRKSRERKAQCSWRIFYNAFKYLNMFFFFAFRDACFSNKGIKFKREKNFKGWNRNLNLLFLRSVFLSFSFPLTFLTFSLSDKPLKR